MTLPHDQDAEKSAVGCVIQDGSLASELSADWFFDSRLGYIVETVAGMERQGIPVDLVTVAGKVKQGGIESSLLMECDNACSSTANFGYWRDTLRDCWQRRSAITAASEFLQAAPEANGDFPALLADLEAKLQPDLERTFPSSNGAESARLLTDHLEYRFNLKGKRSGIPTGFEGIDKLTDGLQPGEQTLIAARPSIGKSAIAMNIVDHVCIVSHAPTLVISLEMSRATLLRRLLSGSCKIPMNALRSGVLSESDFRKIHLFNSKLAKAPLHIVEGVNGMNVNQYAGIIRRMVKKHGIKLVVTDYLQKIKAVGRHEKRTYEIGSVSETARALAVTTNTAFLTLAQLNRESEKDKGRLPRISDLADSGQIERDADCIGLLHRSRDPNNTSASIFIGKQRDGETGPVDLNFQGQYCLFTDRQHYHANEPYAD